MLWLDVDARSGVPIYVQLVEGVRRALEVGTLRPGERLPTVRALAGELTVAPNTVVKAYNELQREGLISSRAGIGTVVTGEARESVKRRKVDDLYERLGTIVRDAAGLGVEEEDLRESFERELERTFERTAEREGK